MPVSSHRRSVKDSLDASDCRKHRADTKIALRKEKKDDFLQKRRQYTTEPEATTEETVAADPVKTADDVPSLAEVVAGFVRCGGAMGEDECLVATRQIRKLLSAPVKPPIENVINIGLVAPLVALLAHPKEQLAFEAAWCLTNIASGTTKQCQAVVDANAIGPLIALLASANVDIKEQAVWALGNIAGDCPRYRDLVLQECGLDRLLALINETATAQLMSPLRNATWLLSNLMRGKPKPSLEHIQAAGPTLAALLTLDDDEVLTDTCWALSYLTEADYIDLVLEANCVPGLMNALQTRKETVQTPALRALSTMLSGSDTATQVVLDTGFLAALPIAMSHTKARTRKEACWATSNIAAGTEAQVQALFESQLIPMVVERLDKDEFDVKKEAMWTVANVLHSAKTPTPDAVRRIQHLVHLGAIKPMVTLLDAQDNAIVKLVLDALSNLLDAGNELHKFGLGGKDGNNPFLVPFDEAEGLDALERLQSHNNQAIYDKTVSILDAHFAEDGDEDENLVPQVADNAFTFGASAVQQPAFVF